MFIVFGGCCVCGCCVCGLYCLCAIALFAHSRLMFFNVCCVAGLVFFVD